MSFFSIQGLSTELTTRGPEHNQKWFNFILNEYIRNKDCNAVTVIFSTSTALTVSIQNQPINKKISPHWTLGLNLIKCEFVELTDPSEGLWCENVRQLLISDMEMSKELDVKEGNTLRALPAELERWKSSAIFIFMNKIYLYSHFKLYIIKHCNVNTVNSRIPLTCLMLYLKPGQT